MDGNRYGDKGSTSHLSRKEYWMKAGDGQGKWKNGQSAIKKKFPFYLKKKKKCFVLEWTVNVNNCVKLGLFESVKKKLQESSD